MVNTSKFFRYVKPTSYTQKKDDFQVKHNASDLDAELKYIRASIPDASLSAAETSIHIVTNNVRKRMPVRRGRLISSFGIPINMINEDVEAWRHKSYPNQGEFNPKDAVVILRRKKNGDITSFEVGTKVEYARWVNLGVNPLVSPSPQSKFIEEGYYESFGEIFDAFSRELDDLFTQKERTTSLKSIKAKRQIRITGLDPKTGIKFNRFGTVRSIPNLKVITR